MPARVIQLSDPHLSGRHGYFHRNWRRIIDSVNRRNVDLVITTGDLSVNGAGDDDDLRFALEEHARLRAPWRVLPGNHDVGEEPGAVHLGQPVDEHRLGRWTHIAGADHWSIDLDAWRLVGLNTLLFGTGFEAEHEQFLWLDERLRSAPGPVGLFMHKPLFVDVPGIDKPLQALTSRNRQRLTASITRPGSNVRFVASGHLHQHRRGTWRSIELIWAPPCSYAGTEERFGGRNEVGWLVHEFDGTDHQVRFESRPDLEAVDVAAVKQHGRYAFLFDTPPAPPELDFMTDTVDSGAVDTGAAESRAVDTDDRDGGLSAVEPLLR